ncbi:hypothetical protein N656DRAFT_157538 [Canariomyces notabilis]|uniref:Uncharacterized protein n=1 Tax=Canariomyces notabilis TaxID=2074819 RepID=A0AAN6TBP1_9PEZI|nr:hypothetical protein N656DRAFT_157538 [Canariomyces arenarius]
MAYQLWSYRKSSYLFLFPFVFLVFGYFGSHCPLQHPPGVLSLPVAYPSSQIRTFSVHTGTRYNGTHAGDVLAVLGWTQHDTLEKQAMVGLKGGGKLKWHLRIPISEWYHFAAALPQSPPALSFEADSIDTEHMYTRILYVHTRGPM